MKYLNSRGLTLMELLVVISIIVILFALLMIGIRSAMDNAKRVHCQSQLRQIYIAITLYAKDNQGIFPEINSDDPGGEANGLMHYLGSYLEKPQATLLKCTNPSSTSDADSYYYYNEKYNMYKPSNPDKLAVVVGDPVSDTYIFACPIRFKNGVNVDFYPHSNSRSNNVLFADGRVVNRWWK